jgi:hypothetical protein
LTPEVPLLTGSGILILGQEQDAPGSKFSALESFRGSLTRLNLWNRILSRSEITEAMNRNLFYESIFRRKKLFGQVFGPKFLTNFRQKQYVGIKIYLAIMHNYLGLYVRHSKAKKGRPYQLRA